VNDSRSGILQDNSVSQLNGPDLSVIVPAYNEAARLPKTLERLHEYLVASPLTYEIIVIVDGSSDMTAVVARDLLPQVANLRIIDRADNRGKGYTVRQGMLAARGKLRLFTDADNSTDIAHFDKMKPLFELGWDVVIASRSWRDVAGAEQVVSQVWYKRLVGHFGNLWVQFFAVPGIWDTQCGFKAFRGEIADQIFSHAKLDGWAFDIEILALANAMQLKIGIIPARWCNDERSHVRWFHYLSVLRDTLRVRLALWFGLYNSSC